MTFTKHIPRWRLLAATALLWASPLPAFAQTGGPEDHVAAGRALSQHLNTLAVDTHNVRALIGAGDAALLLDDPNGAIGFFGRADEIDPRNGRVKAGLARSLLMLEKPREALRLFDQAVDLGIPETEIARDRGLAYDLRGDSKRAQRDYALAMRRGNDPELTRRMALSLGISGDREQALKMLDPLLYKQDKAAWRARAFILAMSGDVNGANGIARQVMPGNLARPMAHFFSRLSGLSPAQRAAAVHYGQMPSDGRSDGLVYAGADSAEVPARAAGGGLIPAGEPLGARAEDQPATRTPAKPSKEPRRRPGERQQLASVTAAQTGPTPVTAAVQPLPSAAPPAPATTTPSPVRAAAAQPVPAQTVPASAASETGGTTSRRIEARLNTRIGPPATATAVEAIPSASRPVLATGMTEMPRPLPVMSAPAAISPATAPQLPQAAAPAPTTLVTTSYALPAPAAAPASVTPASTIAAAPARSSLADIIGGLELEAPVVVPPPVPMPRKAVAADVKPTSPGKAADEKKPDAKKAADKKAADKKAKPDPKKAEPSRIWAQIATGSDKAALGRDYQKMMKKAPAAFKGKTAWTAPYRASRRLLVGPFDSQKQAQDFLGKAGVTGFAWTSAAGEAVEKLPLK